MISHEWIGLKTWFSALWGLKISGNTSFFLDSYSKFTMWKWENFRKKKQKIVIVGQILVYAVSAQVESSTGEPAGFQTLAVTCGVYLEAKK